MTQQEKFIHDNYLNEAFYKEVSEKGFIYEGNLTLDSFYEINDFLARKNRMMSVYFYMFLNKDVMRQFQELLKDFRAKFGFDAASYVNTEFSEAMIEGVRFKAFPNYKDNTNIMIPKMEQNAELCILIK